MALRSSTSAPWNSFTNNAQVVWSALTSRMPSLMSALSMMSRICLVMSSTSVRFSLNIVRVFRTTLSVCTVAYLRRPIKRSRHPLVPREGIEPPRPWLGPCLLRAPRLPVPPPRPVPPTASRLEAASGFEPLNRGFADLRLSHLATPPYKLKGARPGPLHHLMERETGFEPATPTLARLCSTTELFPRFRLYKVPSESNKRLQRCQLTGAPGTSPRR